MCCEAHAFFSSQKFVSNWKIGFNASYNYASERPFYNFRTNAEGDYFLNNHRAILPSTNTFAFIGAFINFGIDRTEDAINNNL